MSLVLDIIMGFFALIGLGVGLYGLFYTLVTCFIDCDLLLAFVAKYGKPIRHLKNKVVFITGASSGIGEHTAYALAKNGVKLVIAARRKDELERVKRNCLDYAQGQLKDEDILVMQMDVTNIAAHQEYFDRAVQHFGQVDILFNNAGRSQRALWEDIEIEVDKQMFELNVFAVINLSRIAVRYFNQRGIGHIAVVSSITGLFGIPFSATYTASKHALHGYFNSLRIEKSEEKLDVTILCPGPTYTNFLQNCYTEKQGKNYGIAAKPTDRRMTPQRCGELCAIALANKVREGWMGVFPMMPMCYGAVYFPHIYALAIKVFGINRIFKFRDSQEPALKEGKNK